MSFIGWRSRADASANVGSSVLPVVALAFACFTLGSVGFHDHTPPLLIGYGCEGSDGPVYYPEEQMFPNCSKIERIETDEDTP